MVDLIDSFSEHFEVQPVDTAALKEVAYRLRFEVYSKEICLPGFEAWRYPDGLETDEYDAHSHQCLVRHKPTETWVGLVRLILTPPQDTDKPFPVETFAQDSIDRSKVAGLPRQQTAEITRLILSNRFRRRPEESQSSFGGAELPAPATRKRRFPHPVLALMVGTMRMSVEHDVTHWLAGMEPRLNRLLQRFGLDLEPVGPEIEYHGIRRPYLGEVSAVMGSAYQHNRPIWELLTDYGRLYPPPAST